MDALDGPWVLDELAHAGPEHLDPAFVAGFDRKQGYPPVDDDLEVLAAHGVLTPRSTVVDMGAGTGRFALAAAPRCARVVAVDVSAAMVDHVRRAAAAEAGGTLEVVRAGFLTYEHRGAPADAVHCRHALHQLPDFWKGIALHRLAQVLRPGGVLRLHDLVYDVTPAGAPALVEEWMREAGTDPAAGYTAEDYATHVRSEYGTYRWLLEPLLEQAGFEIVDAAVRRGLYAAYTCRRRP